MGFSGHQIGNIFEGEKKFDLVIRLDKENRKDIDDLKNLFIDLPNGSKIPLSEVADVRYTKGAAQISRDDTRRRIVVGVNVRNRDLQSVVNDIKKVIDTKVKLPVGYMITYGGQFENLKSAKKRLAIAVPIALILIFVLLYLAFHSVKEALLIYSAIPFAAVGGIIFLWLRDLPFSISAGVGFIALFGIAVLNGIVLIEEFKELKEKGMKTDNELIIFGAKSRLRAVLLTALAAALGFLPMAISNGAGAEVQRPLATVVIGGLFTSTLLTLLVLPVLYSIFDNSLKRKRFHLQKNGKVITVILLLFTAVLQAQNKPYNLEELKQLAVENNLGVKSKLLQKEKAEMLTKTAYNFAKTNVFYENENDKINNQNGVLQSFGIEQSIEFPTVYKARKDYLKSQVAIVDKAYLLEKIKLEQQVTKAYYNYLYANKKLKIYTFLDSLYAKFSHNASRKFELGESNYLEKITAKAKQKEIALQYQQVVKEVQINKLKLLQLVQPQNDVEIVIKKMEIMPLQLYDSNYKTQWYDANINKVKQLQKLQKQQLLPDFSLGYSYGKNAVYTGNNNIFNIGLQIPIFGKSRKNKLKASKIEQEILQVKKENFTAQLQVKQQQMIVELAKQKELVDYYQKEGLELSKAILKTANSSFKNGEIDFFQYLQSMQQVVEIKLNYIQSLNQYNQSVININYLSNTFKLN